MQAKEPVFAEAGREREREIAKERKREKTHNHTTVQRFLVRIGKACVSSTFEGFFPLF